jgi:hypothetical protein
MPSFLPGLELSRLFYQEVVKPLLEKGFPSLAYSAALIGDGSEVLGFDTEMSSDHDWGPRLLLFLAEEDYLSYAEAITHTLAQNLPREFRGYSTHFSPPDPNDNGTQVLLVAESGFINHRVEIYTLSRFVQGHLGFDLRQPLEPADWLTFPEQKLRTLIAGAVYQDEIGLEAVRSRFAYYPQDVWLYLMACGWNRIGQEEHLMGRAGIVGDELGSGLIGSRLVRDIMRLCFLMEKQYAPYPKWFGTAFRQLECGEALLPSLLSAQQAQTWQAREAALVEAYTYLAKKHNRLEITEPLPTQAGTFFGRPFRVIHLGGGFADALLQKIEDPEVRRIAAKRHIGSLDQFSDNTDLLSDPCWRETLKRLYC